MVLFWGWLAVARQAIVFKLSQGIIGTLLKWSRVPQRQHYCEFFAPFS